MYKKKQKFCSIIQNNLSKLFLNNIVQEEHDSETRICCSTKPRTVAGRGLVGCSGKIIS